MGTFHSSERPSLLPHMIFTLWKPLSDPQCPVDEDIITPVEILLHMSTEVKSLPHVPHCILNVCLQQTVHTSFDFYTPLEIRQHTHVTLTEHKQQG